MTVEAQVLGSRLAAHMKDFYGIQMLPLVAKKLVQWFSLLHVGDFFLKEEICHVTCCD